VVRGSAYNLHRWANITQEETANGLKILESPDSKRLDSQEHEGRRIQRVDGGWLVLNGQKYEDMMRKIAEQARKAKWARENRARSKKGTQGSGEPKDEIGLADLNDHIENGRIIQ